MSTPTLPIPAPARYSPVTSALAADRLGVPAVVFFVMSAATPLTVVSIVVTTGFAATGLLGIPAGFAGVGLILGLFSVGFVTMARCVGNSRVDHAARYLPKLALFRVVSLRTGHDSFPIIRLSSDYDVSVAAGCRP
jgi:hypothetical protein